MTQGKTAPVDATATTARGGRWRAIGTAATLVMASMASGCSPVGDQPASPPSTTPSRQTQPGVHAISFYSPALKKNMAVEVYLPPGYNTARRYPVLYLFHGKDGRADTWMDGAIGINRAANQLITSDQIQPLIIVSPQMDNGYGINTAATATAVGGYNRGMYEDYIIRDLVPYIDRHYSTAADSAYRYIGGLSMGGFAALHDAFLHPDLFSKVGVISAALWVGEPPAELRWIYPDQVTQAARDPITIAAHRTLGSLSILMIEGKSDPFLAADRTLDHTLQAHGDHVVYREYPGGHNYGFWRAHAAEMLVFFAGK
ncbi:MAG: esterase [Alicyclobacillus macrosporangiidus]|uniref:alpha/beta hydrolase n=1 Tax=Alicyclobacillus macrosporangiidus TaxID=392015 RepID=UPI0026EB34DC|nr:alpha/beta hydrolase-fold protein [Alicyclobacillus macrosporangiidus]MCL6597804.1 esterase [Alicyclobacillus macrosporangiidus]